MAKNPKSNQIDSEILKIAEEIVSNNQVIKIDKLYNLAKKKLNYSNDDLNLAIYNLILNKSIIPEKKLIKKDILSNARRKLIYEYITENPGTHLREIRDKLDLNPHVASIHLKALEGFDFIYQKKYQKYSVFFPIYFSPEDEEPLLALKHEKAQKIFIKIYELKEATIDQIKEGEDIAPKMIGYHLVKLIESEIITNINKNGQDFYKVNENKFNKIKKYLKLELREKEKPIEATLAVPITPVGTQQPSSDLIRIKREYDFVGGEIRFKTAIQNTSNTVVTDINVTLIPTSQYEVPDRVKIVDILRPGESRGVDFFLTPLTCGKSKVFGSVSYMDPFGNPQTTTIPPKEIWIKCPLVIPKTTSLIEIDNVKKQLQKGITKIPYTIGREAAFTIVLDQISALDLSEIKVDDQVLTTIHSGLAKVTNDNMIIESRIEDGQAVLTVWTRDMKQATGFLAYIKNLIKMSFELHNRMEGKIEKISQKILDTDEIFNRFATLFQYCEEKENWKVGDIILLINEIKSKIERSIPGSSIIENLKDWIEELQQLREGDSISTSNQMNLEYDILGWIAEINRIGCNQLEVYQQSFPEKKIQIDNLCTLTEKEDQFVQKLKHIYGTNILQYLMVINKNAGLAIYQYDFSAGSNVDADLISGFLTAIQDFGMEISRGEDSAMKKLAYKNFQIELEDGKLVKLALILQGQPIDYLTKKSKGFIKEFEEEYQDHLVDFTGNIQVFRTAEKLVKKHFS